MDQTDATPASSQTFSNREIKPRKGSFLFPKLVISFALSAFFSLTLAGVLHSLEASPWLGLLVFALLFGLGFAMARAAYRKERYEIQATRLICHRGGLISDEETEFEIRNITHVKIKLPWLRYKFLKVGNVIVETAGTSQPLVFRSIHDPESVYSEIANRMKANGYDLTKQQLLHEESPSLLAVTLESIAMFFVTVFLSLFGFVGFLNDADIAPEMPIMIGFIGTIVIGAITFIVLRFIDIMRRKYRVFNDVVVYEEGFLTRENAFIPYENISDSDTKRTLIDQILGLYDVTVSCQGSSSEIKFRRLKNGILLSQAIDQIVTFASQKVRPPKLPTDQMQQKALERPRRVEPKLVANPGMFEREYRITPLRMLMPAILAMVLILPLFPLWIAGMIDGLIKITSTRFFVRQNSIRYSYSFLKVEEREFTCEKITGVVIKRDLFDRMLGTVTLKFQSIGSHKAIEFMHVKYDAHEIEMLLRHVGIPDTSNDHFAVPASFHFMTWMRSKLWNIVFFLIVSVLIGFLVIASEEPKLVLLYIPVLVAVMGGWVYAKLYYSRQRLRFHDHHVEAEQGILAKKHYYVRYKNIKRVTTTLYPGGESGSLQIFIAGEEDMMTQVKQKDNSLYKFKKQSSFATDLVDNALNAGRLLDDILSGRADVSQVAVPAEQAEILLESSRSVGHAVFKLVTLSVIIFPLALFLPLTLPATFICIKRWRYRIESFRVVWTHGVLFREITTVLFDRVDSLQKSQGPLNKMFGNGTVSIMTAGSSKSDLVLVASPDYLKLYEAIRINTD